MLGISHDGMKNLQFDPKIGFLLETVTELNSGLYMCFAKGYGNENTAIYQLEISRKGILKVFLSLFYYLNLLNCFWLYNNSYDKIILYIIVLLRKKRKKMCIHISDY